MKRHTVLAALVAPLLALGFAVAAQAALPDAPTSETTADAGLPEPVLPEPIAPATNAAPLTVDPSLPVTDVVLSLATTTLLPGSVLVSGYVEGVEADGTCTMTLTRGDEALSIEGPAEADATTTVCAGLTMIAADLTPGTWTARLGYASPTRAGVSGPTDITVG